MLRQFFIIFIALSVLSSCAQFSLKRSASNKLVDFGGFESAKRRPVYNKKYIDRAKRNIRDNNIEDEDLGDDAEEITNPYAENRMMYRDMIRRDQKRSLGDKKRGYQRMIQDYAEEYPDINEADATSRSTGNDKSSPEVERELTEIKKMLAETKKDMAKYRCPMQQQQQAGKSDTPRVNGAHSISDSIGVR